MKLELVNFINAVRDDFCDDGQYAVEVLRVMDGIYQSDNGNTVIDILSEKANPLVASLAIASPSGSLQTVTYKSGTQQITSSQGDPLHLSPKL